MANYALKNGNLTTFSGSNPYNLTGTSGEYAKSNTQQTFTLGTSYNLGGSFSAAGSITVCIMIFDTNGVQQMSNQLVFSTSGAGTMNIVGNLIPTKTAVGEIRVLLYPGAVSSVSSLGFAVNSVFGAVQLTCGDCGGTMNVNNTASGQVTLPSVCTHCSAKIFPADKVIDANVLQQTTAAVIKGVTGS